MFAYTGCLLFSPYVLSHSGSNPVSEIQKYDRNVKKRQSDFVSGVNTEKQMENLKSQIDMIQGKLMTIRNMMARDHPHVVKNMSRYKYDYMAGIKKTLGQLEVILEQTDTLLDK